MANSNGWGDGASNNLIGWGQGADNAIGWGDSHLKSWAGATDIAGFDTSAISYFNSTGISGATQQDAIDNLIRGLKDDGIWSKMKAVYPFVTDNRNLLGYSEDFANSTPWGRTIISVTSNTTIAPNGTLTADTLTTNSNVNNAIWNLPPYPSTGQTFTNSIYLKYNNAQWVTVEIWNGNSQRGVRLWVDIQNGVLGTADVLDFGTYLTSSIQNIGNGWYRVSVTGIMPSGQDVYLACRHVDGNGAYNFTAVNGKSTFIWGAQSEIGTLTAYQPIATTQQAFIANQFKYNLVNPIDTDAAFRLVFNGGWTHSSTGALPNGTNGYADTKFVPSAQFSAGNNSSGIYIRTENTNAGALIGTQSSGNSSTRNWMFVRLDGTNYHEIRNNTSLITSTTSPATSQGYWMSNRITTAQQKMFRNGSSIASNNHTENATFSTVPFFISCQNNNGSAAEYSNRQLSFAHIGNGLTDTEAANLYTRVQAFQTALNRQV
jgi:hypothetical protein